MNHGGRPTPARDPVGSPLFASQKSSKMSCGCNFQTIKNLALYFDCYIWLSSLARSSNSRPMTQVHNFINGEVAPTKSYFSKLDLFTGEAALELSQSEPLDFIKTIQPAQKAFADWRSSSIAQRLELLHSFQSAIEEKKSQFITATAQDLALPKTFIAAAEFQVAFNALATLQNELKTNLSQIQMYSSVGPMGFVLSSNLPLRLFVENVLSAVLAGNSAIIKFSSISANFIKIFNQVLAELTAKQKLPNGLIQVVSGTNSNFKNFFVTHPGIKALTVVGSSATLQAIHQQVATTFSQQFKKLKFLGGSKNLSIVLSEFDESMANQVFESFLCGQGQLHWNAARLFVLEKNVKPWLDIIQTKLNALKPSTSIEDTSLWTPVFKSAPKYQEINQQAKADQAKLFSLSAEAPRGFLKPIFTQDMSNCSALQQDQVHAPLFILSTVKYPFDIPKYANVSYYGDTANIWCEPDKGQKVISELEVANISMNKWSVYSNNQRPGVKHSSFGMTDHRIFGAFNSNAKNLT